MDRSQVVYWLTFITSIVFAVLASDWVSRAVAAYAGLTGVVRFIASFIAFALAFFGILYGIGRITRMNFFCRVR
jgi:hypothetical protein